MEKKQKQQTKPKEIEIETNKKDGKKMHSKQNAQMKLNEIEHNRQMGVSELHTDVTNKLCLALVCQKNDTIKPVDVKYWPLVETEVKQMIIKQSFSVPPRFQSGGIYKGFLLIKCNDEFSKQIVNNYVAKLGKLIAGKQLNVVRAANIDRILEKQNRNLKSICEMKNNPNMAINTKNLQNDDQTYNSKSNLNDAKHLWETKLTAAEKKSHNKNDQTLRKGSNSKEQRNLENSYAQRSTFSSNIENLHAPRKDTFSSKDSERHHFYSLPAEEHQNISFDDQRFNQNKQTNETPAQTSSGKYVISNVTRFIERRKEYINGNKKIFSPENEICSEKKHSEIETNASANFNTNLRIYLEHNEQLEREINVCTNTNSEDVTVKCVCEFDKSFSGEYFSQTEPCYSCVQKSSDQYLTLIAELKRKSESLRKNNTYEPKMIEGGSDGEEAASNIDVIQARSEYYKSIEYLRKMNVNIMNSLCEAEKLCRYQIHKYNEILKSKATDTNLSSSKNCSATSSLVNPSCYELQQTKQTQQDKQQQSVVSCKTLNIPYETSVSAQTNPDLHIAIIDRNNKDFSINMECWFHIETHLLKHLAQEMERNRNTNIGMFNGSYWQYGTKIIRCENVESLNFIKWFICKQNALWTSKCLDVIPVKELPKHFVIKVSIPPPHLDEYSMFKILKGQNHKLCSDDWKLVNSCDSPHKNSKNFFINISANSLERLKLARGVLFYGINAITAILVDDDDT